VHLWEPLELVSGMCRAMKQAFARCRQVLEGASVADSCGHDAGLMSHRRERRTEAIHEENEIGKRSAERHLRPPIKCIDNSRKPRNRSFGAAIRIPRPLATEL